MVRSSGHAQPNSATRQSELLNYAWKFPDWVDTVEKADLTSDDIVYG